MYRCSQKLDVSHSRAVVAAVGLSLFYFRSCNTLHKLFLQFWTVLQQELVAQRSNIATSSDFTPRPRVAPHDRKDIPVSSSTTSFRDSFSLQLSHIFKLSCHELCIIERRGKDESVTCHSGELLFALQRTLLISGELWLQTAQNLARGWHTGKQGTTQRLFDPNKSFKRDAFNNLHSFAKGYQALAAK